ncbi:MAG: RluA family pseudouridine synthase [Gammaproteobacteria bacterium]|nr:RluA family pseudouridine synthase [Gammaproteobacteria bacterium]|tara:strand:- start:3275 stop:4210 length:936 start_codon:yes stop_codon:yes gene_type:complete
MQIVKKVSEEFSGMRLDKASSIIFEDFSRTQLKKWIIEGRILLNNELASPKETVHTDDEIEINPISEIKTSWEPEEIHFEVIKEENEYLIINKPSNLIMHPGAGCHDGTLANGLLFRFPELRNIPRAGIVHRLDKDTSGIILIAKTEKFRNYFVQLLQERKVKKNYKAIVVGKIIGSFEITDPIGRDKNNRTKMAVRPDGKEAFSFVRLEESFQNYSLLDISIETGRTHQIRVHLSSKKLPIIGDKIYNPSKHIAKETRSDLVDVIRDFPRQALHSYRLSFEDPHTNEILNFEVPMHEDMKNLIKRFKKHI